MNLQFKKSATYGRLSQFIILILISSISARAIELVARNLAVELTATLSANPPEIKLNWVGDQYASSYKINRKHPSEKAWIPIGTADGADTSFVDRQIAAGTAYEYQVIKTGSLNFTGYGYILAGINLPLVENRGRIIVLAESDAAETLAPELRRFEYDLIGDGWTVARGTVSANDSPPAVKARIKAIYDADPSGAVALLLFGRVPVAYSGNIAPDEHDNHRGAWPADAYYGDLDGQWTDDTVRSTWAERPRNHNVPGDGKFDQSEIPSEMELQVGRVDLSNMTCFLNKTPSRNEIDLLRQYLDKNHRFRHRFVTVEPRALLFDRLGVRESEAMAAMAWRNFSPFTGGEIQRIADSQFFPTAASKSFLWSAVCAGGGYNHADWIGASDGFALNEVNVVFAMFVGSYYGDWDNESNFLRAALGASGTLLASTYAGKPHWLFHPMALGETIGYSTKLTQENDLTRTYLPIHIGNGQVHIALLGDPSLRAHPIEPAKNLRGVLNGGTTVLNWEPSTAPRLLGYHVYRAPNPGGPFQRLTANVLTGNEATIPNSASTDTFMVRAIALTESPSGTYQNASQGLFHPNPLGGAFTQPPTAPVNLVVTRVSPTGINLRWVSSAANESGFIIQRKGPGPGVYRQVGSVDGEHESFMDTNIPGPGVFTYRVNARNEVGVSPYSNELVVSTLSATVEFLSIDLSTQGDWLGSYGAQGYVLPGIAENLPSYSSLLSSNSYLQLRGETEDPRGLQIPTQASRTGNCWGGGAPFGFNLDFSDDASHQVAFYTAAWTGQDTELRFQIFDRVTGQALEDRKITLSDKGAYLVYNIRRQVHIRITPPSIYLKAEIYGIFLDSSVVWPVQIEPAGGTFNGKVQVGMTTVTPGAGLHYTLDGSNPVETSPRYTEPFWLHASAYIRARAFKDGAASPIITEGRFTNTVVNSLDVLEWDDDTSGSWNLRYGAEGFYLPNEGRSIPQYAEMQLSGETPWIWNDVTVDPRALFRDAASQQRRASAWYTEESMTIDLNIHDTRKHEVALYFVDWDRMNREQLVEVLDANGTVERSFLLRNFQDGRYLVLTLQGAARVRITRKTGTNALLSGIFFDSIPMEVVNPPPPVLGLPYSTAGYFNFVVEGQAKTKVCLDQSSDLQNWICTGTNLMTGTLFNVHSQMGSGRKQQFFRTHYAQ